jgi:hypothetical protein
MTGRRRTKKKILEIAEELDVEQFTPAEVEQIRRQLIARFGAQAKASAEYIHEVLEESGLRVNCPRRPIRRICTRGVPRLAALRHA